MEAVAYIVAAALFGCVSFCLSVHSERRELAAEYQWQPTRGRREFVRHRDIRAMREAAERENWRARMYLRQTRTFDMFDVMPRYPTIRDEVNAQYHYRRTGKWLQPRPAPHTILCPPSDSATGECVICTEVGGYQVTCCKKFYHVECLTKWLALKGTCPTCRRKNVGM